MHRAIPAIGNMTSKGVLIDREYLEKLAVDWEAETSMKVLELNKAVGHPINWNSPKQKAELFYDELGFVQVNKRSTDAKTVAILRKKYDHIVLENLSELGSRNTIYNTFIKGILERLDFEDTLYTSFNQTATATGRLSSTDPNLQNIPARIGNTIRKAFIARPGHIFVNIDYAQLEFRVIAHYAKDETAIEYINANKDIHRMVASLFYDIPENEVTKEQRQQAKVTTFGLQYLRSVKAIADEFEISIAEATKRINILKKLFPGIFQFLTDTVNFVEENHYVESILGRRRRFTLINEYVRQDVHRQSVNAPIQGTASDICVYGGIVRPYEEYPKSRGLINVHDSILFEPTIENLKEFMSIIPDMMRVVPFETDVKFDVEIKVGENWGEMEDYNGK